MRGSEKQSQSHTEQHRQKSLYPRQKFPFHRNTSTALASIPNQSPERRRVWDKMPSSSTVNPHRFLASAFNSKASGFGPSAKRLQLKLAVERPYRIAAQPEGGPPRARRPGQQARPSGCNDDALKHRRTVSSRG